MNVLFLTLYHIESLKSRGIYEDLFREFARHEHNVYIVSPIDRRCNSDTTLHIDGNTQVLELKTGNIQKTNIIEKGISTLMIESQFISAVKKYFPNVRFDLVIYSTPPITLAGVVKFIKERDNAKTYLLLKDIFPQNAVDIGLMSKSGIKGMLYKFFRSKEKQLYAISDRIGCMSPANVEYLLKHNPEIDMGCVEVCPNSIEPVDVTLTAEEKSAMRLKYGIPADKTVFVYGGNLGKPQGISFLIDCLRSQKNSQDVFFLIVGDGTEYQKLLNFVENEKQSNVKLMSRLPKEDYDKMIASCDVGMIFLDYRFTIPNFPSRLLTYMQARLPVLTVTDPSTDIGKTAEEGKFGWRCKSCDVEAFSGLIDKIKNADLSKYKQNAWDYLSRAYNVRDIYLRCFAPLSERNYDEKNRQENSDNQPQSIKSGK